VGDSFVNGETRSLFRYGREVSEFILSAAEGSELSKKLFRNEELFLLAIIL
jgi:hypothetical protein